MQHPCSGAPLGSEESWSLISTQESWLTLLLCLILLLLLR
jgi:hypothetical protein